MICLHSPQPLTVTYLEDGRVKQFHGCAACVSEWREQNRVIATDWADEYVRWVVEEAEVKRRMEKGNENV